MLPRPADGPKFRHRPQSVQVDLDATVTLVCDVDGNPTPEITWIHEERDRVSGSLCCDTYHRQSAS